MLFERFLVAGFASTAIVLASPAHADTPLFLTEPDDITIDGVLDDWEGMPFFPLDSRIQGTSRVVARAALASDRSHIYVAASVVDPSFVRTKRYGNNEDHLELLLSFPDDNEQYGRVYEVKLFPGKPGEIPGRVVAVGLGQVRGSVIVEAPTKTGYSVEAKVPWSLFPPATQTRIKIRGALRYLDGDGRETTGIVASATSARGSEMPLLSTASEQSLERGLVAEKGLRRPTVDLLANVAGDGLKERVLLYDRYLVVLGPGFRGGSDYFWSDIEVSPTAGSLPMFEVRDVTGDGRGDIIIRKRVKRGNGWREMLQVLSFYGDDTPGSVFEHETGIGSSIGSIENTVAFVPSGRTVSIVISLGTDTGYDASNYQEPVETEREPLLLPWGTVQSRTFAWDRTRFVKRSEQSKAPGEVPPHRAEPPVVPRVPSPPPPRPPSSDELLEQVYSLYKREHGIEAHASPTFDFVTNVAGSDELERIICHGRDLVVFGKGFREGRGYVSLSLQQFQAARDIHDVSAFDLTGDGRADIIVRGTQRAAAPDELGQGEIVREVVFVYRVDESSITRVFGAETAVSVGRHRMHSLLAFVPTADGYAIEIRPGRVVGWTRATWPYGQDTEAVSGVEPLVLPWTARAVRYRYEGLGFVR